MLRRAHKKTNQKKFISIDHRVYLLSQCKCLQVYGQRLNWAQFVVHGTILNSRIWNSKSELQYRGTKCCNHTMQPTTKLWLLFCKTEDNKTQCQPCKRLYWPIIPHSWSGLEKGSTYGCDHFGVVNNHFLVWQPHGQTTNRLILV